MRKGGETKKVMADKTHINILTKGAKIMAENGNKKVEFTYHPAPVEGFNNQDFLVTRIGVGTGITDDHPNRYDRFEIAFKRYKADNIQDFEEAIKQLEIDRGIEADYQKILDRLVSTLFTAPDYHSVLCYQVGDTDPNGEKVTEESPYFKTLKPKGHEEAQKLADGFMVGAKRTTGPSQKKLAQDAKAAEQATGMSVAEMAAKIKAMQEAGKLD